MEKHDRGVVSSIRWEGDMTFKNHPEIPSQIWPVSLLAILFFAIWPSCLWAQEASTNHNVVLRRDPTTSSPALEHLVKVQDWLSSMRLRIAGSITLRLRTTESAGFLQSTSASHQRKSRLRRQRQARLRRHNAIRAYRRMFIIPIA